MAKGVVPAQPGPEPIGLRAVRDNLRAIAAREAGQPGMVQDSPSTAWGNPRATCRNVKAKKPRIWPKCRKVKRLQGQSEKYELLVLKPRGISENTSY